MSLSRGIGPRDNLGSQGPLLPGYGCATPPVRQCRAPGAHRCGIAAHRAGTAVGAFIAGAGACVDRDQISPKLTKTGNGDRARVPVPVPVPVAVAVAGK